MYFIIGSKFTKYFVISTHPLLIYVNRRNGFKFQYFSLKEFGISKLFGNFAKIRHQ